jgi:hypothetical protein
MSLRHAKRFLGRLPDDDLPESPENSSDEDADYEEEEDQDDDDDEEEEEDDEDEEEADDEDDDSGDGNYAIVLPSDGDGMYSNLCALY